jgi:CO/xanthine dehydrogenase FAD-binding subunit
MTERVAPRFRWTRPGSLADALERKAADPAPMLAAGGTDLMEQLHEEATRRPM